MRLNTHDAEIIKANALETKLERHEEFEHEADQKLRHCPLKLQN